MTYNTSSHNGQKRHFSHNAHTDKNIKSKPKGKRQLDAHEQELIRYKKDDAFIRVNKVNGGFVEGKVMDFDKFTVSILTEDGRRTIFKHAISEFGLANSY